MSDRTGLPDSVVLDGESLTPEDVTIISRHDVPVELVAEPRERVRESREHVESVLDSGEPVHGIDTGLDHLVEVHIDCGDTERLQTNLVRNRTAGAGYEFTHEEVRSMMVSQANTLVKGFSGVRPLVADLLVSMLNEGIQPVTRSRGSLDTSSDPTPLVCMVLILIGEGEARVGGERLPDDEALRAVSLEPVTLASRGDLVFINGTQLTIDLTALFVIDAEWTIEAADVTGALATEVTVETVANRDSVIHGVRSRPGQQGSVVAIRRLTAGSIALESHRDYEHAQDAYSIHYLPWVRGAVGDAVSHLHEAVRAELSGVTDNPFILPADAMGERVPSTDMAVVVSAGNFHDEPLTLCLNYTAGVLTKLVATSERRTNRTLSPGVQESYLPSFLTKHNGLRSGYIITQCTAAALLNECWLFGHPSIDSTPVGDGQKDYVSMSGQSTLNAYTVVENVTTIVGVELLCGSQTAEFLDEGLELGTDARAIHDAIRFVTPSLDGDRRLDGKLETAANLVRSSVARAVVADAGLSN